MVRERTCSVGGEKVEDKWVGYTWWGRDCAGSWSTVRSFLEGMSGSGRRH